MPGVYEQIDVDRIQQANDVVDVVGEYVSLTRRGSEWVGICPFHEDHRPSMYVTEVKQIFKCFACGAGGDVFKFVQMHEHLTFPQAIERLAQRAGITLERRARGPRPDRDENETDPVLLARVNDWACRYFELNLSDEKRGAMTRAYLQDRQISAESAKTWRMGLALPLDADLIEAAEQRNIPRRDLEAAGLITLRGQDKFVNRLMFPITDVQGRVIGFGGRTLGEDRAKYVNSPTTRLFNKSDCLYGLEQARHAIVKNHTAVVVEGYTDCIMAHQLGCSNVVATLGTSFTNGHGRLLRRYATTVVLIFDGDTAGSEAANRALDVCLKHRIDIKVASVPHSMDPCEYLLGHGADGFRDLVAGARDVLEFKWDRLQQQFQANTTLSGQKSALEEFLQTVALALSSGNVSVLDRGIVVNRIATMLGMDRRHIDGELNRRLHKATASSVRGEPAGAPTDTGQSVQAVAQQEILEVLLNEPKLFELIREEISVESFDVPIQKEVAGVLFELLRASDRVTGADVLARIDSVEVARCVTEWMDVGERKGNYRSRLDGALQALNRKKRFAIEEVAATDNESITMLLNATERAGVQHGHNLGMIE
ncbi:MAG: DNA primase [Planctomycetes bacterium]|nr:DNA primase [Planctomycetota bacterium]